MSLPFRTLLATALLLSFFCGVAKAQSAASDFVVTTVNNQVTITGYNGAGGNVVIPAMIGGFPVTVIGEQAFYGVTSITSVTVPAGVTEIQTSAFSGCTSMTGLTLPGSVTAIDDSAFSGCTALTTANLGNGVVTVGDDAFAECTALTNVSFPNTLTTLGDGVFDDCAALTTVNLGTSLTTIGQGTFSDCSALVNVTLPASVTTIGTEAFYDTALTSVNIPGNVTSLGDSAFGACAKLTSITVDPSSSDYSAVNGVLYDVDQKTLVQWPAGISGAFDIPAGVTTIGDYAFYGCTGMTSVTIPTTVTAINMGAFGLCSGLTTVTIPSGVTTIGDQAFYGCTGLGTVTIAATVTNLGNLAFYSCTNLADAVFLGNAPTTGFYIFGATALNFVVSYTSGATGFTPGTWTDSWGDIYSSTILQSGTASSGSGSGGPGSGNGSGSSSGSGGSKTAQTITFPSIANQTFGVAPFTVSATASSGLAVAFRVVSGPAVVSGNKVALTGAGTVVIGADQAGNATYSAATEVTNSFTVSQASQTITAFGTVPDQTYGARPFNIATPVATSKLPVTVSVKSGPATIVGSTVTVTGVGTVVLAADQAGNSNYSAAPEVTTSFTVESATQTISSFRSPGNKIYSTTPFAVVPPTATSGLPVTVSVLSGPATISDNLVTMTGTGTVVLAADQGGNSNYSAATEVTTSFTIGKASQTIAAFAPITGITYGSAPFSVTAPTASSGLPVALSILSGPATLVDGVITVTGVGTVVLAADQSGNDLYNAAREVTVSIAVAREPQTITAFNTISAQTYGTAPFTITLPTASSGLAVTVALKGPAQLAGNTITITGVGAVTLSASQGGNTLFAAAPVVTTSFMVNKVPQTISAFASIPDHTFGDAAFTITAPTASSSLPVKLSILSGPARISGNTISITGGGTVTVAANQPGNSTIAAAPEVTTSFVVNTEAQTIAPLATIPAQTYGARPISVSVPRATSGLPVTLSIKSGPATISSGRVTITGVGTVVIAADQAGSVNFSAATEVTTSFTVSQATQTISSFRPINGKTSTSAPFTISLPTATSGLPVTVTVLSGPATISGNTVTITGSGTVVLAADQAGNANYAAAPEVTYSFTVN